MLIRRTTMLLIGLMFLSGPVVAEPREVFEIDIAGLTCAFCVYGVEKNLGKLPGVAQVQVSLKFKKARIVMEVGEVADETLIRETIRDAGFTPRASSRHAEES